jgi:hypothetical protein
LVDWFYPRIQNYRNSHGIPIPLWHRHGSVAGFTSFGTESGTPLVLALAMAKARREGAEGGTAMAPRWESTTSSVKMDIYIYTYVTVTGWWFQPLTITITVISLGMI